MVGMAPVEVVSKAVQMLVNNVNSGSCIDRLLQEHVSYFHHNTMWVSCVRFILNSKNTHNLEGASRCHKDIFGIWQAKKYKFHVDEKKSYSNCWTGEGPYLFLDIYTLRYGSYLEQVGVSARNIMFLFKYGIKGSKNFCVAGFFHATLFLIIVISFSPRECSWWGSLCFQAILLMALACGRSSIRMQRLTNRAKATMLAVETFTEVCVLSGMRLERLLIYRPKTETKLIIVANQNEGNKEPIESQRR